MPGRQLLKLVAWCFNVCRITYHNLTYSSAVCPAVAARNAVLSGLVQPQLHAEA
jgi:hypothetical protein